jgi:NADPH:quinone reductase-like Zn-dependent oxidoreductase
MLRLAGKNAHFVTYGAMAKEALSFPPSVFIFNNLTAHGFWQTEWFKQKSQQESARIIGELVKYMATGKVCRAPFAVFLAVCAKNWIVQRAESRNLLIFSTSSPVSRGSG